ncbi:hypothetical protein [Bacteriovorax sp. Seq25_V]|uniref:hypothetical protein n=1 Tax=Bacteriovorax sp. Seq25_V TaxID=1201288 RepID=UPI00038A2610|nr:hypothetical protein [Bacteriovorax sp. Seq25_V]EQC43781.1 hypothetical protein M900_1176 [Bacteriovorax sp. Seq25_V]
MNKIYFKLTFIFLLSLSVVARINCPDYKAVVCHAGSEINPHYVEVCVSFSSLYGHLAEHENDYYGECGLRNVKKSYVCNAGMRHQDVDNQICINKDEGEPRFVSQCEPGAANCVCTSAKDLYLFDYFSVELSTYNPLTEVSSNTEVKNINAGKATFNVATTDPAYTRITEDNGLSFKLGSERLNGEYFVDTCWMNTTGLEQYSLDFTINSSVIAESSNGISYPIHSGLHSRFLLYCDQNFDGNFDYSTVSLVDGTSYLPFGTGQQASFDYAVSNSEFCFIRQSFKEIYPDRMRDWDLKNITVLNNVESHEEVITDGPIRICHVQEITNGNNNGTNGSYGSMIETVKVGASFQTIDNKKIYECTNLRFNNSDHLKSYIKYGKDEKDFRDVHQHDYVGICNNICGPIHGNGAN